MTHDQLTIVLPVLNEEECLPRLLSRLQNSGFNHILAIDGHSTDKTQSILNTFRVPFFLQMGKGKTDALKFAFIMVNTPMILVMDADGSYYPEDIDSFLALMENADFVKASRGNSKEIPILHRLGNRIITSTFNSLFGSTIEDVCSGMYLLRTDEARKLNLEKHFYTADQEICAQYIASSKKVLNAPITYGKRIGGRSKTRTWRHGLMALYTNFELARIYNPILLFSFIASLALLPGLWILLLTAYLYLASADFHSGYLLFSMMLFVIGGQGLSVATISSYLRKMEHRLRE